MKLRTAFLVGIFAAVHSSVSAQTPPTSPAELPTVRAGLFRLGADGQIGGSATETATHPGEEMAGTVYLAPCEVLGATSGDKAISAAATDAWKLTGTVLELTADQASVQIGWQRVRRDGQDEASAPQSTTLTLKRGERTTLETISMPARGSCAAKNVLLDVTLETMPAFSSGGGRGGFVRSSAGSKAKPDGGSGGGVAISAGSLRLTPADVWLVRTAPGRADQTSHQMLVVRAAPSPFAFAPVTIQTQAGTFTVTVRGTVESGLTPMGEPRFFFSANRTTTFAPATRAARDTAPVVESSTKTSVPMPGPDEVLSFEMPPLRVPGGAAISDKVSVRVKLRGDGSQDAKPR